jgi:polar amino acid transport system permease protein
MPSVIGVAEPMRWARAIGSERYRVLASYTIVGVIFMVIPLPAAGLIRMLETSVRTKPGMSR